MTDFDDWARRHPLAAADLKAMLGAVPLPASTQAQGSSEAAAQQRTRMAAAQQGALAWRNNVGATPAKCKHCGEKQQPVRYGLANDSSNLNKVLKSSDLILAIPRIIRPEDVGNTLAQFGSVESKAPGWTFKGTPREKAQLNWLALIRSKGGFATFSTGELKL